MTSLLLCIASFIAPQPAPAWDALFQRRDGWIGGDGAYSVALSPQRILWLFSDTWVGKVRDGKRTDATIVNNTLALQNGLDSATAKMEFIIRRDAAGKAEAFLKPEDGRGWFWLHAGVVANHKLYLFLLQIERTNEKSVFGFRQIGEWLAVIDNPNDHPLRWRIRQLKLPFAQFTDKRELAFGAAARVHGDDLYVYGTLMPALPRPERHLVLARVKVSEVENLSAWLFYDKGQWQRDPAALEPLVPGMAAELSVHQQDGKDYVLVFSDSGLSPKILRSTAPAPWGPWSKPEVVYTCPEMKRDKNLFTYAAKAHPWASPKGCLLVTYVVNSFDFWQIARDATLYWPRFVTIPAR